MADYKRASSKAQATSTEGGQPKQAGTPATGFCDAPAGQVGEKGARQGIAPGGRKIG